MLPALALVGLTYASVPDLGAGPRIDVVAPGVLALAVLSTAFTGQAIGTAFDRRYGVLRLLGTTPLGRDGLLAGRVLAVLVVEAVQVVVLGGARPGARLAPGPGRARARAACSCLAGTAAFVALGLLLAGTLRSEAVLAVANLLWVLLAAGGGGPGAGRGAEAAGRGSRTRCRPARSGSGLRAALQDGRLDVAALAVLLAWAAGGLAGRRPLVPLGLRSPAATAGNLRGHPDRGPPARKEG